MAWISFYGLLIELIGFLLLSYDLLPEYKLHRSREIANRYRVMLDNREWFESEKKVIEQYSGNGPVQAAAELAHMMSFDEIRHLMYRFDIGKDFSTPITHKELADAYVLLDAKIEDLALKTAKRSRPPITLAIWLALIGIVMQLIAAFPR